MKRALISCLLAVSTVASAGPHSVLVLKAEGTADQASRTAVESEVLRMAKKLDGKVDAGDITLSDAAAAAGCAITEPTCKDEILATFAVDELVATTVTTSGAGMNVTVRRMSKGAPPSVAQASLSYGKSPDALDPQLAPLFGIAATPGPSPVDTAPKPPPPPPTNTTPPPPSPPTTTEPAPPTTTAVDSMQPVGPESGPVDSGPPSRRWQKIGMGVGAGMVLLGAILWTQASAKQDDIDNAPHDTPADFIHLRQLEDDADGLAGGGNLFFVAGVALAGISGYYYWKKGRAHRATTATTARITPTVFPHGGGVVLSFGGAP